MSTAFIDPYKAAKKAVPIQLQIMAEAMPRMQEVTLNFEPVSAEVEFFWDEQKRLRAQGMVSTQVEVTCERCLEAMPLTIEVALDAAVVWSEEQASQLSSDLEPWMGANERIDINSLLEDELLLALPIMPAHSIEDCKGMSSYTTQPEEETSERPNPFAGLASLMKTKD